ncbi:MAG: hypothetical protein QF828_16425 [Pseudomonadales bacterium]|jgi:predicted metal-dependent hydrolase|nr:hypothetical protein [Pseudomonadales bacterium]HJN51670.1 hypothetical protein [Pseudomonadales bacterium]|tara:strand:- start:566 stop:814 length:249 start_codon:yes stop_codon:yes gene_type:complete
MDSNDLVTPDNYRDIRAHLDGQIEHFLINRETWVLTRFKRIPPEPSPTSIDDLGEWISTYLAKRAIRELARKFRNNKEHAIR